MKINKYIITLFLITAFALTSNAQFGFNSRDRDRNNNDEGDKFRSEKVAFISNYLDLSPDEAQDFWPVYNEFEKKRFEIQTQRRNIEGSIRNANDNLSNKQVNNLIEEMIQSYQDDADIIREYYKQFQNILPSQKVLKLSQSEDQFRVDMLQKFMGRQPSRD